MAIFDKAPEDWRELQNRVGQLFSELGCDTEISKIVENVRGAKEIDVFVKDRAHAPPVTYLCECKYWQKAVPQEVVHSFRTVVQDTGAHRGFIISTGGFQKGAYEAAQNTNIDLLSFDDLQSLFFDRWRVAMAESFMPHADVLFPYWDFPGRMPKFQWNKSHSERQDQLTLAYKPLIRLGPLTRLHGHKFELPMRLPAVDQFGRIDGEVHINTYRELFDFMDKSKETALYHFQVLHGEVEPDRLRGEYDPRK